MKLFARAWHTLASSRVIALTVCALFTLGAAIVVVMHSDTILDEGEYLYNGWMTISHGWRPFADIHTRTLPLIYYIYGIPQAIFGRSLLFGRIQATAITLITLALSALLARRLSSGWAAPLVVGIFAFNLTAGMQYYRALAIAPTALCLVLALYCIVQENPRPWHLYAGSLATACLVLCRHDMIPVAALLWLYLWWDHRQEGPHTLGALGAGIALLGMVSAHFFLLAPRQFAEIIFQGALSPGKIVGGPYANWAEPRSAATVAWHLMMFFRCYLPAILLLAPAVGYCLRKGVENGSQLCTTIRQHRGVALVLGVAAVNYFSHLLGIGLFGFRLHYMLDLYIFFPVAIGAAASFVLAVAAIRAPAYRFQLAAFGIVALLTPLVVSDMPPPGLSSQRPTHLEQIATGAEAIRRLIPEDVQAFSLDDPHQFLAAERKLFPELTWQLFLFSESNDTETVRARHYYNKEMIDEWLRGKATYAVIGDGLVDWMLHSGRYERGEELRDFIFSRLEANYTLLETVQGSYMGPTHIYRLKEQHP